MTKLEDFYPDDWQFCDGFCQVCENKYRCTDSPYFIKRQGKET